MTTQDSEVIDRNGKRVTRKGILEDGDRMVVKMTMMDAANPALVAGAALAAAVKRNEQFDARGHRPGFLSTQDAAGGDAAREARDAIVRDAWRNPPPVVDQGRQQTQTPTSTLTHDELITARDKRLENAWRNQ